MSDETWSGDGDWNPSGRYLVTVLIGDGGESYVTTWPECVANPDTKPECSAHCWEGWVTVGENEATNHATIAGIELADEWFRGLSEKEHADG